MISKWNLIVDGRYVGVVYADRIERYTAADSSIKGERSVWVFGKDDVCFREPIFLIDERVQSERIPCF